MNIRDVILINVYAIKSLVPCILFLTVCTAMAFVWIIIKSSGMWFGKKSFERYSIFVELNSVLAIKLACAWIKLLTVTFFLVSFVALEPMQYVFLLVPCVIILVLNLHVFDGISTLINILIQLIGVVAVNILCNYIHQFGVQIFYISIYILMAMVIELYSVYVFITELDMISNRRNVKIEKKRKTRKNKA